MAVVCAAQVFVQIGAFFWPALLPQLVPRWNLSNSDAGWITAAFYGAYMLGVPVLVPLTDRIDAKKVYLFGVGATILGHLMFGLYADGFWSALVLRALTGFGWAGTYMTGVKLLADQVDERLMSRAVTGHAASIGVSGALSFSCAGLLDQAYGWRTAFVVAASSAAIAFALVGFFVAAAKRRKTRQGETLTLFDFRPVLRNRSALAYSLAYCVHTLEMSALRGWGVAFLGFVAISPQADGTQLSPAYVLTLLGLIGTVASVLGNEAAIRVGRRTLVSVAMAASVIAGCTIGVAGAISYWTAVAVLLVYGFIVWLDSSSLTAGAAGTADPARRGATLAVHSTLGYAGGFVGPLIIGFALDMAGGMSTAAWSVAFGSVATLMLLALITFRAMRPRDLVGDRSTHSKSFGA